jgi:two-component system NtrC family sensor kinase
MRGTDRLAEGHLDYRIRVESSDELGMLAESFNEMARELDDANAGLRQAAQTLEERIQRKTAQLEAAQRGLIQTEKMVSLGRLAATVAHEVNNPLFGMLTYARLTIKDLERGNYDQPARARMLDNLRIIERESRRCGDLMKNLLAFARQAPPQRAPVQLNVVVDRAVRLVAHQYELAGTALITELPPDLPEVPCDAGQIQQVLIVLLANAAEALGKGGEVVVRTAADAGRQGVLFSVSDNGPGIAPDLAEKIFEPFFSTKDHQHRTGLGLAVAKGIIDRHGGSIELDSAPGAGAEFTIHLPLVAPPDSGGDALPAEAGASRSTK